MQIIVGNNKIALAMSNDEAKKLMEALYDCAMNRNAPEGLSGFANDLRRELKQELKD